MALGRAYTVTGALVTVATTSATPILCGTTGASVTMDISAIRVSAIGAATFPANATWQASLYRATGTAAGGTAATPRPHNPSDIAANSTWLDASGGAITGLTQGAVVAFTQALPFTAGANWGEWVTPGFEWRVSASTNIALYLVCTTAGTSTQFEAELIFTE